MKYIGPHVSIAGGLENAPLNAAAMEASGFAMFTKNQRQWKTRPLTDSDISDFKEEMKNSGYRPDQILPHDGYLINMANPDPEKRKRSLEGFIDECQRCEALGLTMLNFHPGSRLDADEGEGLRMVADCLKTAVAETDNLVMVIENTAGQGSALGYSFEHLAKIIELTGNDERMGVCIDTCHAWAAGYDLKDGFLEVWDEFDRVVGFRFLRGMHLNDAKKPLGSRVDRHAPLGEGKIGWSPFEAIAGDSRFDKMPLILETPEPERWPQEIARLKNLS